MTLDRADQVTVNDQPNQKNDSLYSKVSAEMGNFMYEKTLSYQSDLNPQKLGFPDITLSGNEKQLPMPGAAYAIETNGVVVTKDGFGRVQKSAATSLEHTSAHANTISKAVQTADGWSIKINKRI